MGGPEMAPQTPQRSERPGTAGAFLYTPHVRGARPSRGTPRYSDRRLALRRRRRAPEHVLDRQTHREQALVAVGQAVERNAHRQPRGRAETSGGWGGREPPAGAAGG